MVLGSMPIRWLRASTYLFKLLCNYHCKGGAKLSLELKDDPHNILVRSYWWGDICTRVAPCKVSS